MKILVFKEEYVYVPLQWWVIVIDKIDEVEDTIIAFLNGEGVVGANETSGASDKDGHVITGEGESKSGALAFPKRQRVYEGREKWIKDVKKIYKKL